MDPQLLLRGMLLGFSIAAPVGPIGVLCIRRTLAYGRLTGLLTGLGAATADMLYGAVAAFGLAAVSSVLVGQQVWIRLIGGIFLCYLGVVTLLAQPKDTTAGSTPRPSLAAAYVTTLFLTLTNPLTILSFAAIFAGLGVAAGSGYGAAALLVVGVFCGSALWWVLLSGGVGLARARLNLAALRWINRLSGTLILGFGVIALVTVARSVHFA